MEHTTSTYLNKLLQKISEDNDTKFYIFLHSAWSKDCINLSLQETRTGKCFKGTLTNEEINESASELEINYDVFYEECRNALTANIALPGFEYELDINDKLFKLTKNDKFQILYLEINVKETKSNYEILETAIDMYNAEQKSSVDKLQVLQKNDQDYKQTLIALQSCLDEKDKLQNKLLKKFANVLNSKKEKIAELEKRLGEHDNIIETQDSNEETSNIENSEQQPSTSICRKNEMNKRNKTNKNNPMRIIDESEPTNNENDMDYLKDTQPMTMPMSPIAKVSNMQKRRLRNYKESNNDENDCGGKKNDDNNTDDE